jgi:hypothetical protein
MGHQQHHTQAGQNVGAAGGGYPSQFAAFGQGANFFSDPMAAQMGFNVARAAMSGGTDFAEKNVCHIELYQTLLSGEIRGTDSYDHR